MRIFTGNLQEIPCTKPCQTEPSTKFSTSKILGYKIRESDANYCLHSLPAYEGGGGQGAMPPPNHLTTRQRAQDTAYTTSQQVSLCRNRPDCESSHEISLIATDSAVLDLLFVLQPRSRNPLPPSVLPLSHNSLVGAKMGTVQVKCECSKYSQWTTFSSALRVIISSPPIIFNMLPCLSPKQSA